VKKVRVDGVGLLFLEDCTWMAEQEKHSGYSQKRFVKFSWGLKVDCFNIG